MTAIDIYRTPQGRHAVGAAYEELLRRWPVPAQQLIVPTRLGDTFIMASGPEEGPALVLLHGSGTNAAMWIADVPVWAGQFRVYAVDIVGEPGRSAPVRPPLGADDYAGWLDDVFDTLGLARASLIGASLGGWLALDYATNRPQRVERLVLTCPGGLGRQKLGWVLPVLLLRPFGTWGMHRSLTIATGLDGTQVRPFLDYMTVIHRHFRPRTQRLPVFNDDALAALTMPVLVIVGDRDAMLDSRDTVRRLNQAVPHAVTTLLPGVGHSIVGQAAPILQFLESS
jgi:pimeloyl-ACP methyl ester carboxylesterase